MVQVLDLGDLPTASRLEFFTEESTLDLYSWGDRKASLYEQLEPGSVGLVLDQEAERARRARRRREARGEALAAAEAVPATA